MTATRTKGRRRWMALASVSWRGYRSFVRRFNFSWRARPRHRHPRRSTPRSCLVRGGNQPVFLYSPPPPPRPSPASCQRAASRPLYSPPRLNFPRFPRVPFLRPPSHPMCVRVPRPLGTTAFASITTITWRPLSPVRFKKKRKEIFSSLVLERLLEGRKGSSVFRSFQNRFVRYGFARMNLIIN